MGICGLLKRTSVQSKIVRIVNALAINFVTIKKRSHFWTSRFWSVLVKVGKNPRLRVTFCYYVFCIYTQNVQGSYFLLLQQCSMDFGYIVILCLSLYKPNIYLFNRTNILNFPRVLKWEKVDRVTKIRFQLGNFQNENYGYNKVTFRKNLILRTFDMTRLLNIKVWFRRRGVNLFMKFIYRKWESIFFSLTCFGSFGLWRMWEKLIISLPTETWVDVVYEILVLQVTWKLRSFVGVFQLASDMESELHLPAKCTF